MGLHAVRIRRYANGLEVPIERLYIADPINEHTPAARGKVLGPADRLRRDEVGEKLYRIWKNSVETKRQTGVESGPFQVKDWMR